MTDKTPYFMVKKHGKKPWFSNVSYRLSQVHPHISRNFMVKTRVSERFSHEKNPAFSFSTLRRLVRRNLHHEVGPKLGQVGALVLDHVRHQLVLRAPDGFPAEIQRHSPCLGSMILDSS